MADAKTMNLVGKRFARSDAIARVTGAERYTVDVSLPRMLHGRILSSPYAHAKILMIDTSEAEAMAAEMADSELARSEGLEQAQATVAPAARIPPPDPDWRFAVPPADIWWFPHWSG